MILFGPVQIAIGMTSAATSTMTVEVRMASQSGTSAWMTRGNDYNAMALAISKVTRNKWW